ncbi:MAG: hypothetical protein LBJ73_04490 [Rickettsiales bacterium]|jgi:hypothetical protein|nr:hypothetical protein [Rickettsiales bacterium]
MKNLTSKILMALVVTGFASAAQAEIASKKYVDDQNEAQNITIGTSIDAKQNKLSGTQGSVVTFGASDGAVTSTVLGLLATKSAVASDDITDGTIVDADIATTAAIAKSKLAEEVRTSLGKADTALQSGALTGYATTASLGTLAYKDKVAAGDITAGAIVNADIAATAAIEKSKLAQAVQDSLGLADTALQSGALSGYATTGSLDGKQDKLSGDAGKVVTFSNTAGTVTGTTLGSLATKSAVASSDITDGTIENGDIKDGTIAAAKLETAVTTALNGAEQTTNKLTATIGESDKTSTTKYTSAKTVVDYVAAQGYIDSTAVDTKITTATDNLGLKALSKLDTVASAQITDGTIVDADIAANTITSGKLSAAVQASLTKADGAAQESTLGVLAKAVPGTCGATPDNKCVLTYDGTSYAWEKVER